MRNRRNLPSPAEVVRDALAEARRDGLDFERAWEKRAWPAFMRRMAESGGSYSRDEWKVAIAETRGEWEAAYEGRDTAFSVIVSGRDLLGAGIADYLTDPWTVAA